MGEGLGGLEEPVAAEELLGADAHVGAQAARERAQADPGALGEPLGAAEGGVALGEVDPAADLGGLGREDGRAREEEGLEGGHDRGVVRAPEDDAAEGSAGVPNASAKPTARSVRRWSGRRQKAWKPAGRNSTPNTAPLPTISPSKRRVRTPLTESVSASTTALTAGSERVDWRWGGRPVRSHRMNQKCSTNAASAGAGARCAMRKAWAARAGSSTAPRAQGAKREHASGM